MQHQAKQLFKQYDSACECKGAARQTADEAEMALLQPNGDVWIAKCQVHAEGRVQSWWCEARA